MARLRARGANGDRDRYLQEMAGADGMGSIAGLYPSRDGGGTGDFPLGAIRTFAGNFAPNGAPQAEGQLLSIGQNTALFSLLGFSYGGDGRSTFALPDLRLHTARLERDKVPGLDNHPLGADTRTGAITLKAASPNARWHQPADRQSRPLPADHLHHPHDGKHSVAERRRSISLARSWSSPKLRSLRLHGGSRELLPIIGNEALFQPRRRHLWRRRSGVLRLPDFRGRNVVGLSSSAAIGSLIGIEDVTLTSNHIPTNVGGGGAPFDNRGPGLALTYMIAIQGYLSFA